MEVCVGDTVHGKDILNVKFYLAAVFVFSFSDVTHTHTHTTFNKSAGSPSVEICVSLKSSAEYK